MLGNPYSSLDPDLGPLMREIKNKICRDCELVALLEDDNGMELLVNNKIISLDLPVKDVYQKVWLPDLAAANNGKFKNGNTWFDILIYISLSSGNSNQDSAHLEPMRIVYRMRGLLGDATEEFIETLENKESEDQDEEEVYRLAGVMGEGCEGLEVMLGRMEAVEDAQDSKQLLTVLLKLFGYCIKVKRNRDRLLDPNLRAIPVMLRCLKLCLSAEEAGGGAAQSVAAAAASAASTSGATSVSESILQIMERLLVEAASGGGSSIDDYVRFATDGVTMDDISDLLSHAVRLRAGTDLHSRLMRVLPFLTYACPDKMTIVVRHFDDVLDFENAERRATAAASSASTPSPAPSGTAASGTHQGQPATGTEVVLEEALAKKSQAFVALCEGIERNQLGNTMKEHMMELGIVEKCVKYIAVS